MKRLIEATVTFLELRDRPPPMPFPLGDQRFALREEPDIALDRYRQLYDAVGRPHHWTSRRLADDLLAREIHGEGMSIHVLEAADEPAGWFELEAGRQRGRTRIVHFGIMPAFRGRRLARPLLGGAIEAAFATGAKVVTLETNSLDHPAAMHLYRSVGFQPVNTRVVSTPAIVD